MATALQGVATHITKQPGVCGGKAAIDDTRVRVNNVIFLYKQGSSPEEIRTQYPQLSLAQIHAALAYYYDHSEEIEAELLREEGLDERLERARAEYLARRATP